MSHVRIGIAGPVGSGKTALIEALVRKMAAEYSIGVVTNDIYTHEDAQFLTKNSVLPADRIVGVETGGCPHTAIREDASMNLEAVEGLVRATPISRSSLWRVAEITFPPRSPPSSPMPQCLLSMWQRAIRSLAKAAPAL